MRLNGSIHKKKVYSLSRFGDRVSVCVVLAVLELSVYVLVSRYKVDLKITKIQLLELKVCLPHPQEENL